VRANPVVVIVVLAFGAIAAQRAMRFVAPAAQGIEQPAPVAAADPADDADAGAAARPVASGASLGVALRDVTNEDLPAIGITQARGALVGRVLPDGAAANAGMSEGDVVLTVGRESVFRAADLVRLVGSHVPGDVVELTVLRGGQVRQVPVRLGAPVAR